MVYGPKHGTNWKGRMLDRCPCKYHQKFFKVVDLKELCAAKRHYSIRGVDDLYSYLNPEDKGCGCRITIEEHGEDVMKLSWTGQTLDWRPSDIL